MLSGSKIILAICIALGVALAVSVYQRADHNAAHYIITGGDIITMDADGAFNTDGVTPTHVAIHGERIIAVGSKQEIQENIRWFTRTVDLKGQTLMPGMIDAHSHPVAGAVLNSWLDVSGFSYPKSEQVYAALKRKIAETPKGEVIQAFGLDTILTPDLVLPTRQLLDELAPDNPVFILSQIMHTAWFNSAALEASGYDDSVQDPPGGYFERSEDGRLNGVVHEEAMRMLLVDPSSGLLGKAKQLINIRRSFINEYNEYAKAGLTTITALGAAPMFDGYMAFLEHIATRSNSPVRTFLAPMVYELHKTEYTPNYENGLFRLAGVKFHLDGSPWTGGMATAEPYLENDFTLNTIKMSLNNRGILKYESEDFKAKWAQYHDAGWQITVHAHGERAHGLVLDAIEQAQLANPRPDARHRMEHLGLFTQSDIKRASKLGVNPSFFINHIYYFGPTIRDVLLGEERAERFMPLRWATENFEQVTLHLDAPAMPIDPWRMLKTATTRIPRFSDQPFNTSQLMSVQHALEAVTIDAAYQLKAEDDIGSIEVGKFADFTLLNKNPLKTEPEKWDSIRSTGTWLAGKLVWH